MKFRVLKNKWLGKNKTTGQTSSIKKGEVVEFGLEDIEEIDSLIRDLAITPEDDTLIKSNARYTVLHSFKLEINGEVVSGRIGDEPQLGREVATHLMARGYIIPTNPEAWYPGERSFQSMHTENIKKMYDLDEATEKPDSWVNSWGKK